MSFLVWLLVLILSLPFKSIYILYHFIRDPRHVTRVIHSHAREFTKLTTTRSAKWPTARRHWLDENPRCAACGTRVGVQVHHVIAFEVNRGLELDPSNFITLCMHVGGPECHLYLGHGGNFQCWVPNIRELAATVRNHPHLRKQVEHLAVEARKSITPK